MQGTHSRHFRPCAVQPPPSRCGCLTHFSCPRTPATPPRNGKWEVVPGEALLPGDVISIGRPSGEGNEDKVVPAGEWAACGGCLQSGP
jgi:hypothetical protein